MEKMKHIVETLNHAADVYYNKGTELMSNKEYDALYDELEKTEKETGVVLENSPTKRVGYAAVDSLLKERHEFPALSLDKTKDIMEFPKVFDVRDKMAVVMWKLDGSTMQLTYDNGKLTKALTRGDGETGSIITHNAPYIKGIPMKIPYKGHLVVRGEATMSYQEFERINSELPEEEKPYKNARNLANATITLLDSREMSKREIWFHAFNLVYSETPIEPDTFFARLAVLSNWNFNTVECQVVPVSELKDTMEEWGRKVPEYIFPVDGLVVAANDVIYASQQPGTGHNPHKLAGYAFKWEDETVVTVLKEIEWSASRTGLLNPVAIFEPIELEGTTVSRASIHNVSTVKQLQLRKGDKISVYKANKIIPQIDCNLSMQGELTENDGVLPKKCPVCGSDLTYRKNDDVETVYCKNPDCSAKHIGKFVHFCERDCMNIEGLSEATLTVLVGKGYIHKYEDIFRLGTYKDEISKLDGFGSKKVNNLLAAIEKARTTSFVPFIHALGIPNIGKGQAKLFAKAYDGDIHAFFKDVAGKTSFTNISGIGEVLNNNLLCWGEKYLTKTGDDEVKNLMEYLRFEKEEISTKNTLAGKTFVITGSVNHFANREELKSYIERLGGKTSGSVSAKTSYLINNDVNSTTGKNKKAKELGIPIISEDAFLKMTE